MTQNKKESNNKQDIEKWLKINTFICPHGLGRLSPEQCEANRKRTEGKEAWLLKLPPRPKQCGKCTEWKQLIKEVKQRRRAMSEKKIGICINCKEEKPIQARGLCAKCYYHLKKEGKLPEKDKKRDIKDKTEQKKTLKITLDFTNYPELLEQIKKKAEEEIRSVNSQIIWELKKALNEKSKNQTITDL